ncbi:MAG: glycosyltransferase [Bacteroidales bacterium]|jgi:glycosyltransferase involved in cell wall biosynthesis|nr:glycosyltransferase [Bacteroidales bacterium]
MNILHIATKDTGGAGIASLRIHSAVKDFGTFGVQSRLLLLWDNSGISKTDGSIFLYKNSNHAGKKIGDYLTLLNRSCKTKNIFSKKYIQAMYYDSYYFPETHYLIKWADIIHLHWVNGFVNPVRFFKKVAKPVVWTFHDMTPFSGGNPYESGIFENNLPKFDRHLIKKRECIARHGKIFGHATSFAFKDKANEYQTIREENIFVIPYPLNPHLYSYKNRDEAAEKLNIPKDKPVILFVAADVGNYRKGVRFLLNENIRNSYRLIMAGAKSPELEKYCDIIQLGSLNKEQLCLAYSLADLFVTPSIEEAFGQTSIEALYCGTPVVAFPTSGAKQIIRDGENGFIAEKISEDALCDAIKKAQQHVFDREQIASNAKATYNPEKITALLVDMYKKVQNYAK